MINDLISDFLTRIRNSINAGHKSVTTPKSRMLVSITTILKQNDMIKDFVVTEDAIEIEFHIDPKTKKNKISELKRISKPGIRKYVKYKEIKPVYNGFGIGIYSTPKGVMDNSSAVQNKVGGEYLCYVF